MVLALQMGVLLTLGGCASTPGFTDGAANRFGSAFRSALSDNGTWPLLLGAAAFKLDDFDERVADYAMEHRPFFSNDENASQVTDDLRSLGYVFTFGTALATDEGWSARGKRVLVESSALFATRSVTVQMNERVSREYPNGSGDDSFGSHHAASPFAAAALTRRNTALIDMPGWAATSLRTSAYVAAAGSAWGRIEMGIHYPSDQLASAAIGNFIAIFIHDAFLPGSTALNLSFLPGSRYIEVHIPF